MHYCKSNVMQNTRRVETRHQIERRVVLGLLVPLRVELKAQAAVFEPESKKKKKKRDPASW